jgi:hypothetical protein
MSDQISQPAPMPLPRVFKIGTVRIVEDETTATLSNEQIRAMLRTAYPEVAHATITERTDGTVRLVEFMPQPGRKG